MSSYKFPKSIRLTNKKKFSLLFESGRTLKAFPFKLIYILGDITKDEEPFQIAFTVPKRGFKQAVDRNYIKRRMKEAFRLYRHELLDNIDLEKKCLYAILIYTNREKMDYASIEKGWVKIQKKLMLELNSSS